MPPTPYGLSLYRGDSAHYRFLFWNDSAKTIPHDLDGVTVKASMAGAAAAIPFTCTVTLPNTVDVVIPAAAWMTHGGVSRTSQWDLQFTYADGTVRSPIAGPVSVRADVTDAVGAWP